MDMQDILDDVWEKQIIQYKRLKRRYENRMRYIKPYLDDIERLKEWLDI